MAGIGWRLERLIDHGSLAGVAAAYATGGAVMTLPWVLTTVVLVSLPAVIGQDMANFATARLVVDVAFAVALLVDGPLQIVIARQAADRLFEKRLEAIAAPFRRGLGLALVLCALVAALSLRAMGVDWSAALCGAALAAAVGGQWTALSVGNGLCSPALLLGSLVAGAVQSFVLGFVLVSGAGLGIRGYLFGLISGQTLTLAILLVGIFRALPETADEHARLRPAFRDYAPLACAGLAFNASLWIDKALAAWRVGGETSSLHALASTMAWLATIPCLAWIFVEVETSFQRPFRAVYLTLEAGSPLTELKDRVRALSREVRRLLVGAVQVQAGASLFLALAAGPLVRWLELPATAVLPFRLLLVGTGLQAIALLGLIVLYHFDYRREALLASGGLLLGVTALTLAAIECGLPPSVGTTIGCAAGAVTTWYRVFRGAREVLERTLLEQPFGREQT